jgi:hypothetical protein
MDGGDVLQELRSYLAKEANVIEPCPLANNQSKLVFYRDVRGNKEF